MWGGATLWPRPILGHSQILLSLMATRTLGKSDHSYYLYYIYSSFYCTSFHCFKLSKILNVILYTYFSLCWSCVELQSNWMRNDKPSRSHAVRPVTVPKVLLVCHSFTFSWSNFKLFSSADPKLSVCKVNCSGNRSGCVCWSRASVTSSLTSVSLKHFQ